MAPRPMDDWDEEDRAYKCCCEGVHLKAGAQAVAGVEVGAAAVLGGLGARGVAEGWASGVPLVGCAAGVAVVAVGLVWGVRREVRRALLPHLAVQVLGVGAAGAALVVLCVLLASGGQAKDDVSYLLMLSLFVGLIVEVWFTTLVFRTFRFLRDKDFACGMDVAQLEETRSRLVSRPKPVEL